jgi:alginate O-acetyltransferase complex protein AlgI
MTPVVSPAARLIPAVILWIVLGATLSLAAGNALVVLLLTVAASTYAMAVMLEEMRAREQRSGTTPAPSGLLLPIVVGVYLLLFAAAALMRPFPAVAPFIVGVVMCHAIAFLVDVHRGDANTDHPLHAALYLIQLPVIVSGPLSRYREFSAQLAAGTVKLGAFAYGVRRVVTGLIKAVLVGGTLAGAADAIFAAAPARLSAGAAWLGAVCIGLQIYVQFSGWCDIGIGVGRMVGLRYSENFRRPYTAGSIREFWRRWNVTLITWLRDYLHLPIAGQEEPTLRLYGNIIAGFCLVALWHGSGWTFPLWGLYCGSWLALEAIGLRARIERLPAVLRHAYVILVVTLGWVILRATDLGHLGAFLTAMSGLNSRPVLMAGRYLDVWLWTALITGAFAAGPLVPSVSRWRVSVDAATTSLLMMLAATGLFLWRGPSLVLRSIWRSHET